MRAERFVISDRSWQILEPVLPGSSRSRGVTAKDNRLFLEAVLWKVRVGGAWRDLPLGFGAWTLCSGGFAAEQKLMYFNVFST